MHHPQFRRLLGADLSLFDKRDLHAALRQAASRETPTMPPPIITSTDCGRFGGCLDLLQPCA
ncbi:hypothetical protein CK227_00180 [Mesorhizobium sp. WSM4308]|nr:hypothetical protein CK232_04485 [Mesorhizobium sp. WSM4304]PBB77023.1 hypothetical protein CK227_00180 [Mesorhizobium sp. WSM4308]